MKARLAALGATVLALAFTGACATSPTPADAPARSSAIVATNATVSRVVDGDTVHVTMPDGTDETVRFLGINAPETTKGHHDCMGQQATDFVTAHTAGAHLLLVGDPTQANRDKYGRLLRYITVPDTGEDIDLELVQQGLAREYTVGRAYQRQAAYRQAQREAQAEQRGGWAPVASGGCAWT